ncbi:MAG: HDIG domain-containing protein, partial [Desulfoprunum sp.]|nr:HDIG domain-containing protein [Desulfoprunum sp.]
DLEQGILRSCPAAFSADPLRMLRGFRLSATLGFGLSEETLAEIVRDASLIGRAAAERINHEFDLIMASARAFRTLQTMHRTGLLGWIVPELYKGLGVEQPEFHHLDVFHHSFLALERIEAIIEQPARYYPGSGEALLGYLQKTEVRRCLKWAALLHDIGKPGTREVQVEREDRVTFYGHDEAGSRLFQGFAERLKWSNEDRARTGGLIAMHMHPFHLCNVRRTEPLSKRSILKLCKRAGGELCGLFLLAMADSLASKGEKKPTDMETELADLLCLVLRAYEKDIRPVLGGPPLLSGRDLIAGFGLQSGPIFAVILKELEALRVEGRINNRAEAMDWVAAFLRDRPSEGKNLPFDQDGSF